MKEVEEMAFLNSLAVLALSVSTDAFSKKSQKKSTRLVLGEGGVHLTACRKLI